MSHGPFGGPLESRPNPSNWAGLLDLALPALDHAMPDERARLARGEHPRWTLGGGTALALRFGHRTSDDIDVFLSGVRLAEMTPARNPPARAISDRFQWPGSYLKFEHALGEVDFLGSALQTEPGFSIETFRGRALALETPEEVIAKKLRYRAANFTQRDAYDLACVLQVRPEVALTLALEVGDAVPRARLALQARRPDRAQAPIRAAGADFAGLLRDIGGEALRGLDAIEHVGRDPISAGDQARLTAIVASTEIIRPGDQPGLIAYGWTSRSQEAAAALIATLQERPLETKAALIAEWGRRDPAALVQWNANGRRPSHGQALRGPAQSIEPAVETPRPKALGRKTPPRSDPER